MLKNIGPAILIFCLTALSTGAAFAADGASNDELLRARELSKSVNAFAFDLYKEIAKEEKGSIFFSPLSISMALALAYEGAAGETREEMRRVLHYGDDPSRGLKSYLDLVSNTPSSHGTFFLALAIWPDKNLVLQEEYIKKIKTQYMSKILPLDFKDSANAASAINGWAEKNTNGKIKSIVTPELLNNTLLALASTAYFKGDWESKFDVKKTKQENFYPARGIKQKVPFMNREGRMDYYSGETFHCVRLQYTGHSYSMVVMLPKEIEGLASVEKILNGEKFSQILGNMLNVDVNLYLPKIKTEKKYSLGGYLSKIGMVSALGLDADFSKLSRRAVYIKQILHQTYLDVNEEYTEAAAATIITMRATSLMRKPILFRADHPFLYFIIDNRTEMIIFIGRNGMQPITKY